MSKTARQRRRKRNKAKARMQPVAPEMEGYCRVLYSRHYLQVRYSDDAFDDDALPYGDYIEVGRTKLVINERLVNQLQDVGGLVKLAQHGAEEAFKDYNWRESGRKMPDLDHAALRLAGHNSMSVGDVFELVMPDCSVTLLCAPQGWYPTTWSTNR